MITLVNTFELRGSPQAFEEAFDKVAEAMSEQPGFRNHRLLHETDSRRYVNIAEWDDEESLKSALAQRTFILRALKLRTLAKADPHIFLTVSERVSA